MDERAAFVAAFDAAGHELWLVGGAVRDRLLGIEHGDDDFATSARPETVEAIARGLGRNVSLVGQRFGTIGVLLDGRWSEITTFRGESYTDGTRWPDVTFGDSIDEDLARRDYTVNAIAENAVTGDRLDPFGGEKDLRVRLLRAVGDPAERFREDPLRILRGMRFASQLDFDVAPETVAGMRATVPLLTSLSQERITHELERLLSGRAPRRGLDLLLETGALDIVLPEFAPMVGCEQNSYHHLDVWGHTVATVEAIEDRNGELDARVLGWAAFVHDIGKPYVRHTKPNGEWGFYGHETDGADRIPALGERLKLSTRLTSTLELLVRRHMDRPNLEQRASVRRFMSKSKGHWRELLALKRADNASHVLDDTGYIDRLEALCREIAFEDAEALRGESPLSGDDLVTLAGRAPGPWIKVVKDALGSMVLDGAIEPGDRAAAEREARVMLGLEVSA